MKLRALIPILFMTIPILSWGQLSEKRLNQIDGNVNRLSKMLKLSDGQKEQAKAIFMEFSTGMEKMSAQEMTKEARTAERKAMTTSRKDQIKAILNQEQLRRFEAYHQREVMRRKRKYSRKGIKAKRKKSN